jgi:protein-glucosylgalactosylhydroxylysine glucosidase
MNGLYNGAKGQSHRARIPNYANVSTEPACSEQVCAYKLNMRQGFFQNVKTIANNYTITQHLYAHRFYNRAIVNRFVVERMQQVGTFSIPLSVQPGTLPSVDLTETSTNVTSILTKPVTIRCYQTNEVEDPLYQPSPSKVCLAHTNPPSSLTVNTDANSNEYFHITTIARSEQEVVKELIDILTALDQAIDVFEIHASAWESDWNKFEISIEGNTDLNQVVHSSIFYLVSNLPSITTNQPKDFFWGLSPGGLPKGGVLYEAYQGHSFWDTEMWMHPPLLLMNPQWSRDILDYRYLVRKAAEDNAANTNYAGYRYPWESAYTGREVTPDCCPEVVEFQHHIISDIAFAYKSHLAATHDLDWWKTVGCDIAWNTAKFWNSRVSYNSGSKQYDIIGNLRKKKNFSNFKNLFFRNNGP